MKQWVNDQLEEWKKEKRSPGRPLDEYGKIVSLYPTSSYVGNSGFVDKRKGYVLSPYYL